MKEEKKHRDLLLPFADIVSTSIEDVYSEIKITFSDLDVIVTGKRKPMFDVVRTHGIKIK